ncbi:Swi3-domain-containing protein [Decorospora gaudefroyi]|uniref:Chromosome segregation in meiosis protein n=1 Tax=Decorospora gaudefroyi TaxID=184978 RepID=A0A6A5KRG5_9PLEO|nr:Swi3-domain-containing protein [Decorospora gaudefroyi]
MAPTSPQIRNDDFDDELDAILNGAAKILQSTEPQTQPEPWNTRKSGTNGGLGVDEEIVITKKRQPAPKLDDQRLLSDPGIPRLRKISKDRLRFKGKGHEYGDIARMLNMYQLWLDDLYPRAKFADALAIIEKVGHSKRMQTMRKDWIDEGKPRRTRAQDDEDDDVVPEQMPAAQATEAMEGVEQSGRHVESRRHSEQDPARNQPDDETAPTGGDEPDDDELDALLAESEQVSTVAPKTLPSRTIPTQDDPFADEMEAMADMEDMW